MRIAQVAPLYEAVPPRLYGGTERIVSYLTEELVRRGHDVTLFASGDSVTSAKLVAGRDLSLRLDPDPLQSAIAAHLTMLHKLREQAHSFDILHFHLGHFLHFPVFEQFSDKTLTTQHGRLDYRDLPDAFACWPTYSLNSISFSQRTPLSSANWIANVYHGLPLAKYPPTTPAPGGKPYLAFLGRISKEKRPDRAVEIARRCGMKLKIAAKVDIEDRAYFEREIERLIDGVNVEYVGEVDEAGKRDLLSNATALLFPIDWPEPFGLVVIEAMACGLPVIAWPNGSMPEIIDEGVTGFLVSSVEEAIAKVGEAALLDRNQIREVFEERFSVSRMTDCYEAIYRKLDARQSVRRSYAAMQDA
ncbi:glycosyltransferase family 4 protein [Arvimicrobium flavum]|uniref:glycosyltransferase family 4 protein n=1 Tax=Arvimicrobium flavum TaxID=3393320 RepID=UPI00237B5654|nr:glycosyltransferase family 4 protein [Mesorhizobium shangrilense]